MGMSTLRVDCGTCEVRGHACGDCVMSVLLGVPDDLPVVLDDAEQRALGALAGSGLVPPLRLVPTRPADPERRRRPA